MGPLNKLFLQPLSRLFLQPLSRLFLQLLGRPWLLPRTPQPLLPPLPPPLLPCLLQRPPTRVSQPCSRRGCYLWDRTAGRRLSSPVRSLWSWLYWATFSERRQTSGSIASNLVPSFYE